LSAQKNCNVNCCGALPEMAALQMPEKGLKPAVKKLVANVLSSRAWEPNCVFAAWSAATGLALNADGPMNGPKPNGMPPSHPGIGGHAGPKGGIHPGAVPAEVPNDGVASAFDAADAAVPVLRVVRSCENVLNTVGPPPNPGPATMESDGTLNANAAVAVEARKGSNRATRIRTYALLSLIMQHPLNNMSY
jgi:hypothetical protein